MPTQDQLNANAAGSGVGFAAQFGPGGSTQGEVAAGAGFAGSTVLAILGPAAAAGPIGLAIGAGVAAITLLSGKIAHLINGCGDACVQATSIVNEAETYVKGISDAYWQTPTRTKSYQAWVLGQLDSIFSQVRTLCGKIGGDPGTRCVQERLVRGFRPPWCTDSNVPLSQCGGWYDVTYDPIANDAGVVADPPTSGVSAGLAAVAGSLPGGYSTAVIAGLILFVFAARELRK